MAVITSFFHAGVALITSWRELVFPDRQTMRVRLFATYRAGKNLLCTWKITHLWALYLLSVICAFFIPSLRGFFQAVMLTLVVWSIRPSTEPKTYALFAYHLPRFICVFLIGALSMMWDSWIIVWVATIFLYLFFETRSDRTMLSLPRTCCIMGITTLPMGIIMLLFDIGARYCISDWCYWGSLMVFPIKPLFVALITVPILVERFHTHRSWYEPL